MKAEAALERLGGVAETRALLSLTSRSRLRRAVRRGAVRRLSRGRYALPTADDGRVAAARVAGVMALRTAAAAHGWELARQPERPEVGVHHKRRIEPVRREGIRLLWLRLEDSDVTDGVTTPVRTVVDCARRLPFDEALAIADSALRCGDVTRAELDAVTVRGAGADAVRRVLRHADERAANPFESVLRALCLDAGLGVEPQAALDLGTGVVHPDLVDRRRRLAVEADSWTFHSKRRAHRRDCARYNLLVVRGWRVLRFTWEQVMHDQGYVRWVLAELQGPAEQDEVSLELDVPA